LKKSLRSWAWMPLVAALIVALDQWSKSWIERHIPLGNTWAPIPALEPYFKITHLTNTGAAFGLFRGQGSLFVLIAVVVIVAVLVYARYLPASNWLVRLCLGLQLGGAIGNLWDRLEWGHVTDFALFTLPTRNGELQWPAFNVADSSIVVGVLILAVLLLWTERETPRAEPAKPEAVPQPRDERGGTD
jgi:signal peptidase II